MEHKRILEEFLDTVAAGKADSRKTCDWYAGLAARFLTWCQEAERDPFSTSTFNAFMAYLKREGYKYGTVHGYAVVLRRLGRWLLERTHVDVNPAREVAYPKKPQRVKRGIAQPDYQKLLDAAKTVRDKALLMCLYNSGGRAEEIIDLRWGDLRLEQHRANVIGKGNKERTVYFRNQTIELLLEYRETVPHAPEDPVWWSLTKPQHPLTYDGLYQMLKRLAARAGVERWNPHAFRHAFGLRATKNGCPTLGLQDLMGHNDPATTREYAFLNDDDLADMHKRYL